MTIGDSLTGSEKVRRLQTVLHAKAKEEPGRRFHSLIDKVWREDFLLEAWRRVRRNGGTAGMDGETFADIEAVGVERWIGELARELRDGTYEPKPVRQVLIPKKQPGKFRPLGIPYIWDRVAQTSALLVLEPIFEADLQPEQYAYRPGRSAHDAVRRIHSLLNRGHNEVVDCDLADYFDMIPYDRLREVLDLRIRDGVVRKMIDKWLKAGILEESSLRRTETGTLQGGVISPLVSNIYLHHVLDKWFEDAVKPRLKGGSQLVRYADDWVMTFTHEMDARRVLGVLGKRLGKYGLTLHETKTRFLDFRPPRGKGKKGASFDFLGFTHVWGTSRKGNRVVRQVTAKSRFARAVKSVHDWCKANRHRTLKEQHAYLSRVIKGHCAYYGRTGNGKRLGNFRYRVGHAWKKALSRRSRDGYLSWDRMLAILRRFPLPNAKVVRSIYAT